MFLPEWCHLLLSSYICFSCYSQAEVFQIRKKILVRSANVVNRTYRSIPGSKKSLGALGQCKNLPCVVVITWRVRVGRVAHGNDSFLSLLARLGVKEVVGRVIPNPITRLHGALDKREQFQ